MTERKDLLNFVNFIFDDLDKLNEENEILIEENETLKKFIDDIINFEEVRNFLLNKHIEHNQSNNNNNNNKIDLNLEKENYEDV